MKKINHLISALIMAAMTAGFASCSSSDAPSSESDNTPKELTITIKTQGVKTKAAETSDPTSTKENTMNRITIGIFDQSGNTVRAIQEFSATADNNKVGAGKNYFLNTTNGTATVTIVTTQLSANDQILVAVNAPASTFAGITSAATFKKKSIDAETALYKDTNGSNPSDGKAISNNIPMFGESTISGSGTSFSATVNPKHLTAKVTLDDLKVDFAADGPYSNAKFTPTEIFMYNVASGLQFDESYPFISNPTFLTGEGKTVAPDPIYLTTGDISSGASALSGTASGGNSSFSTKYYFYITPNNDVSPANRTKLVIKGTFDPDGSGTTTSTVYYPVKLNSQVLADGTHSVVDGKTEYQVNPNKNYKCSVTIKTIGSTGPNVDIDPTTAEITIKVANFDDVSQETVFQ